MSLEETIRGLPSPFCEGRFHLLRSGVHDSVETEVYLNEEEDFAFLHPGGILGHQVGQRVCDVMRAGEQLPRVTEETSLADALVEIMAKRIGMTTVVDGDGRMLGVLADGDLKRILMRTGGSIANLQAGEVMSRNPRTIDREAYLVTALKTMETNRPGAITSLVVVDDDGRPEGVVHIHDCLKLPAGR